MVADTMLLHRKSSASLQNFRESLALRVFSQRPIRLNCSALAAKSCDGLERRMAFIVAGDSVRRTLFLCLISVTA